MTLLTMEAFALLKFWKSTTAKVAGTTAVTADGPAPEKELESDEEESFFELELTLPDYNSKLKKNDFDSAKRSFDSANLADLMSPIDRNDTKLKSKPQSPISILRSAPKLRIFGRLKKTKSEKFETESVSSDCKLSENKRTKLCTLKFKIEDVSNSSKFIRNNSSTFHRRSSVDSDESSRRFSKYVNRIKPLYVKASKRYSETESIEAHSSKTTSFPSPRKDKEEMQSGRFKLKCRQLGKSKSALAAIGLASPPPPMPPSNRKDDSFAQQSDGIEGAILHCKRSFSSTKEPSSLSRCSSDPSHEKSIQLSD